MYSEWQCLSQLLPFPYLLLQAFIHSFIIHSFIPMCFLSASWVPGSVPDVWCSYQQVVKLFSGPGSCRGRTPVHLSLGGRDGWSLWSAKLLAGVCPDSSPSLCHLRSGLEEAALRPGSLRILSSLLAIGGGGSSNEMENEMENVRLLLRTGGTTVPRAPRTPSIPHKEAGHTLTHIQTHTHCHSLCSDRQPLIHVSHTHPVTHVHHMLPEAHLQTY